MRLSVTAPLAPERRRAALCIAGTTGFALFALYHHPVIDQASAQESLAQLVSLQRMDGVVHGMLIAILAILAGGFAVPQLARQFLGAPRAEVEAIYIFLRVIGTIIQVLTKAGLLAMCVAFLAWSYALASRPEWPWSRWCAALGAAAGLLTGLFIVLADVRLNPASLMAIFGVHSLWNLGVVALLARD